MDLIRGIKNNENIRESLIELKNDIHVAQKIKSDLELKDKLIELLTHEDPKVRKNSASLLGYYSNVFDVLFHAYLQEKTEYVKEAYLKGMSMQDCHEHIHELKYIQHQLLNSEDKETKHVQAQLKRLHPLLLKNQPHKKKVLKLSHEPVDVVLTSLPYYQFVIFESVLHLKYKPVNQGVLVRTTSLYDIVNIRSYKDLLIPLSGASSMNIDLEDIVAGMKRCHLIELLDRLYGDAFPFYYRIVDGLREKNPQLIKKISEKVFELYPHQLLNATESYDIEIVFKEVRKGKVNAYLSLPDFKGTRFQYRKETIPTAMQPYVAATLVQLAKPYFVSRCCISSL